MTGKTNQKEEKKERVLEYIIQFMSERGYSPTVREICKSTGIKSTSTVFKILKKLKEDGVIHFEDASPRTITINNKHSGIAKSLLDLCNKSKCRKCSMMRDGKCAFTDFAELVISKQ